jgi:hypothetical protein
MRVALMIGALATALAVEARASVFVEIVAAPAEVYSFEPTHVLFSVENRGKEPVLLPVEDAPGRGVGVYLALHGEEPKPIPGPVGTRVFPHPMRTMWLAPQERWLFYVDIGASLPVLEGRVAVQAVVSSGGICGDDQVFGRNSYPLDALFVESISRGDVTQRFFRCWEGEARSDVATIEVKLSRAPADFEAQALLLDRGGLRRDEDTRTWHFTPWSGAVRWNWWESCPSSHFAYAYLAGGGSSIWQKARAIELQPDNRLNPWVVLSIRMELLKYRSSCWPTERNLRGLGSRDPEQPRVATDESRLPSGARDLLEQQAWYLANRHCPRIVAEAETRGRP